MPVNRYRILILMLVLCGSCIEPFNPKIEGSREVLVINGFISDRSGPHQVSISLSTPYNDPSFVPVQGCVVTVEDESGLMVEYSEISPGVYEANLEPSFLQVGKSYSLYVSTPDGNEYRSDYDRILAGSPIDSVYYEVKGQETTDPNRNIKGVQFFVDMKGTPETASNYRWLMEETWMYTAPHMANYIWTGEMIVPVFPSNHECYLTEIVNGFFSASTRYLSVNQLNRSSLHYVTNESPRLELKYSVLVEQHSLSDPAYDYWDRMESQARSGGGLYDSQPSSTIGNIYNVNDPSERVLGCFYATQVKQKRTTFYNRGDFNVKGIKCALDTIQSVDELGNDYPYDLISLDPQSMGGPPYLVGSKKCFDCTLTLHGGTTTIPEFF